MTTDIDSLPVRGSHSDLVDRDRVYRTSLTSSDYLRLETEALERGMKAYGLTKSIVTLYLNKKLVLISELPEPLRQQVLDFVSGKAGSVGGV